MGNGKKTTGELKQDMLGGIVEGNQTKALSLRDEILGIEERFVELGLPKEKFLKEVSFAVQAIKNNDKLAACPRQSILIAVYNLALTGLTLNPALGYAYLVPRGNVCVLDISYRGLLYLATDSGSVKAAQANCVYENDHFIAQEGTHPSIQHTPDYFGDRGNIKGVYVVAILADGTRLHHIMSKKEVDEIREVSKYNGKGSIWDKWYGEMAIKTVIKRARKLWPHSEKLATAVHILNEHEGLAEPIHRTPNPLTQAKSEASAPEQLTDSKTTPEKPDKPTSKPSGKPVQTLSKKDIAEIEKVAAKKNVTLKELAGKMGIKDFKEMPVTQKRHILDYINKEF